MLNSADSNSFYDLASVYLKAFDHLTWNFYYVEGIQQVLKFDFLNFRILEILNFHPCIFQILTPCKLGNFACCFFLYPDILSKLTFLKVISEIQSVSKILDLYKSQMGLMRVQTVCKGYQQISSGH